MHYDINVSREGQHFFATAERSCTSEQRAKEVWAVLKAKFPESEGWKVSVTLWRTSGQEIDFERRTA